MPETASVTWKRFASSIGLTCCPRPTRFSPFIAEARGVPADELPRPQERRDEGPGLSMVVSLLAASLNQCCAAEGVSASLVGSTATCVIWSPGMLKVGRKPQRPALARGWRSQLCGSVLEMFCVAAVAFASSTPRPRFPSPSKI